VLTQQDNELVTRTGPGTPMGNLIRQYWIPAAMSLELPAPDCAPLRLRLLCEDLIAFRTTSGKVGVVANACPHRGASLFFGRNEEEGLRCVYHGWKFDVSGSCIDMPSEPAESNFKSKVRVRAYPAQERGGMIWVYMGAREVPPPLPSLEANMQPEGGYNLAAYFSDCNWLQSFEGDWDTIHVGFLHSRLVNVNPEPGTLNYYASAIKWGRMLVADTEFGATYGLHRPAESDSTYWRIAHFLFPFYAMVPTGRLGDKIEALAVVPVDDEHCIRWTMSSRNSLEVNGAPRGANLTLGWITDPSNNTTDWFGRFRPSTTRENDYLIDREEQRSGRSYSGIPGRGQDGAVTESMGVIYKRDKEHLGVTDTGIIRMRRLLIQHAKQLRDSGELPPAVDQPEVYKVRSGGIVLPNGVNGIEATKDLQRRALSEEPLKLEATV
jgi:phthalate 4,5-dioxygenase oxygenase subunit